MPGMLPILRETEPGIIPGIAQVWGLKDDGTDRDRLLKQLAATMEDSAQVALVWERLNDPQRAAIQILYHTPTRSMPAVTFTRVAGDIRYMGSDEVTRQNPAAQPKSAAEALYYRGLISLRRENADTGLRNVLFIPPSLAALLPINQTSYDQLDEDDDPAEAQAVSMEPLNVDDLDELRPADTSIVDDMTTLLAFLRIEAPAVTDNHLPTDLVERLQPYLLEPGRDRLRFLIALAHAGSLIDVSSGRAVPRNKDARNWLGLMRQEQVRSLAETWRSSAILDMAHVPGLHLDLEAGTLHQYDPRAVRAAVLQLLASHIPLNDWWALSEFIGIVREDIPDFQRPNGDFNSWYIQDEHGAFLRGIESWDQVDGALLDYIISGPMNWLGLADLAEDAAHLNAYGRAFMSGAGWPSHLEQSATLELADDGTVYLSRKASRLDRYDVSRFTTWLPAADPPFQYRIDPEGLDRAEAQGITIEHIRDFLARRLPEGELPPPLLRFFEQWRHGARAAVTLEWAHLLRTTSEATLDEIFSDPELRRYLGARLGPMAVIVRPDQWQPLQQALGERGIRLEMRS